MCALSFLSLEHAAAHLDAGRVLQMLALLHEAHAVMCEGQSLDLHFESERSVDLQRLLPHDSSARPRSSSTRRAGSARTLPAATTRRSQRTATSGVPTAWRSRFATTSPASGRRVDETGKTAAGDIARRKWTFPVVWAIGQPPSAARSAVADAYASGLALEPLPSIARVVDALDGLGAREAAQRAAAEHLAVIERRPNAEFREFLLNSLGLAAGSCPRS